MHGRTSFGFYEILRILVPGFYVALLLILFLDVFSPNIAEWMTDILGLPVFLIGGTLIAGVSLYVKESPKRRRAFMQNQPSTHLLNRSRLLSEIAPLNDEDAQRMYFYILNNHMPAAFHDKIFFFGTIYTIMINIRRVSFWFGLGSLIGIGAIVAGGNSILEYPEALLLTLLTWLVYGLNVRYNKADRKMQENYQDQIFWLQMHDDLVKDLLAKRTLPSKDAQ